MFIEHLYQLILLHYPLKALDHKIGTYTIDEEDIELVESLTVNLTSLKQQYEAAFAAMYPAQKRLVAIGDLHGDLIATLKVLKLAEVIPQSSRINDIDITDPLAVAESCALEFNLFAISLAM